MFGSCKAWLSIGFTLWIGTFEAFAGESTTSTFNGWTVTIRPRQQVGKPRSVPPNNVDIRGQIQANPSDFTSNGIQIRPVSRLQTEGSTSPAAAPTPEAPAVEEKASSPVQTAVTTSHAEVPCTNCTTPMITPRPNDGFVKPQVVAPQAMLYRDIYFSIPFIRAEYNANPSYRHEATMELLFNQMRPTVIQRSTSNVYQYNYNSNDGYGPQYYPYYPNSTFGPYGYRLIHTP
jgi:hypothetical protein